MKYQVQKKNGPGPGPLDPFPRVQGQLTDLRAEATALGQETKSLRADVLELRSNFTTLGRRVDAVQTETAEMRRELGQVTDHVVQFSAHLETLVKALQESQSAAAATVQTLTAQRESEGRQQQQVRAALQQQRQEQETLALALRQSREQMAEALAALTRKETQLQQNAGEIARTLVELIQKCDQQSTERLGAIAAAIQRSAEEELGGLRQLAESYQKVQECERGLSELLGAGNDTLSNLTRHSEQILLQDRRGHQEHLRTEAVAVNRQGLKALANGRCDEAVRKFAQARKLAPDAVELGFNLAVAHFRQGNTEAARELADELVRDDPGRPELKSLRGLLSLATGDFSAARETLAAAAEAEAQSESVLAAAGLAHLLSGDARSAQDAMRRAAQVAASETQFFRRVGFEATTSA